LSTAADFGAHRDGAQRQKRRGMRSHLLLEPEMRFSHMRGATPCSPWSGLPEKTISMRRTSTTPPKPTPSSLLRLTIGDLWAGMLLAPAR
jgi:hypothetical protein